MIKNNNFFINDLKHIIFFGYSAVFDNLLKINRSLKLKTTIITSQDQSKLFDKKKSPVIFNEIDTKCKNFIKKITNIEKTLFISLGARHIFKKKDIENFFLDNLVNFHGTRLPLDKGGGGYSWKILREDRIDNQLVHLINEKIDMGPIINYELSLFPSYCKIPIDFENYRLKKFLNFYEKFIIEIMKDKKFKLKNQINYLGRYNPRLNTEKDGLIDWNLESYDLYNFICAFDDPYKGASTFLNNGNFGRVYLKGVHIHGGDSSNHPYMAGLVSRHDKKWLVVATRSKHMLLIEKVLDKKGTNIIEKIKAGDRFFTPISEIDKSKKKRTFIKK